MKDWSLLSATTTSYRCGYCALIWIVSLPVCYFWPVKLGNFPQTRLLSSQAFEIIARLLKVGEVVEVKTDPRFAYGKLGRAPDVPPNAEIHYVMALMEIKPPFEYEKMSPLVRV